ncbi:hypothetical protein [Aliidiomarina iranensis]|uniref:hypothetical protein n=1 Tax=Aliidiomarina iranensis TaxID=1434071 RepID=UPI0013006B4D|nr:hypothetical protein [Aliidiomarina iranensis]
MITLQLPAMFTRGLLNEQQTDKQIPISCTLKEKAELPLSGEKKFKIREYKKNL